MATGTSLAQAALSLGRSHGTLVIATACAVAWAWIARFSGLFFAPGASVEDSGITCVAALAVLLVGVLAIPAPRSVREPAVVGTVLAVGATIALTCGDALGIAGFVLGGALQGGAYAAALCVALAQYRRLGFKRSLAVAACACTLALGMFVLVSALVPRHAAWLVAVLPCVSAVLLVRAAPGGSAAVQSPGCHEPERRVVPVVAGIALMVLAGLLAVYMPAMYPKTTNFAVQMLPAGECLGAASWRSVGALALTVGLLWMAAGIAYRRRTTVTVAVLCAMVLVASIFFVLPSMGTSALAFVLFTACGVVAALFAVAFLLWWADAEGDSACARRGLAAFMAGGVLASVFAFVFLGPLYNVTVFQDLLFSMVPAALLVSFGAVLFVLRAPLMRALASWGLRAQVEHVPREAPREDVGAIAARYGLTKRECEVLALLAEGRNEPYVEEALGIGRATVKTHITHIYRKVGVSSRQQLIDVLRG